MRLWGVPQAAARTYTEVVRWSLAISSHSGRITSAVSSLQAVATSPRARLGAGRAPLGQAGRRDEVPRCIQFRSVDWTGAMRLRRARGQRSFTRTETPSCRSWSEGESQVCCWRVRALGAGNRGSVLGAGANTARDWLVDAKLRCVAAGLRSRPRALLAGGECAEPLVTVLPLARAGGSASKLPVNAPHVGRWPTTGTSEPSLMPRAPTVPGASTSNQKPSADDAGRSA